MTHGVFISHSTKDKALANVIRAFSAKPSGEWPQSIINDIEVAKVMVMLATGNANESAQMARAAWPGRRPWTHGCPRRPFEINPPYILKWPCRPGPP